MKRLFRPLLVLVIGYALLTGFQLFLQIPMDWRLAVSKFLLAILATAVIELLNRQPLAVRDVKPDTASTATPTSWSRRKSSGFTKKYSKDMRHNRPCSWAHPKAPGWSIQAINLY